MNLSKLKLFFSLAMLAACMFFFSACDKEDGPAPAPGITSFSPKIGMEEDTVVITGQNFSATASANAVEFNGVSATVNDASASSLTVIVPGGDVTGKITVTVNGQTATSTEDFTLEVRSVNYALTAVATASSTFVEYSVDNINDGDTSTAVGSEYSWTNDHSSPEGKLPQWVELDFGVKKTFTKIVLYSSSGEHIIQDFQIQYWDGANWATIETVVGNTEVISTYTFDAIESAKVRVYATKGSVYQAWFARINELEVWNK